MSRPVDPADVVRQTAAFGPQATLISVGPELRPHAVSVLVTATETPSAQWATLTMGAGATTRRNLAERPACTLWWAAPAGSRYALILDGTAEVDDTTSAITVHVDRGILHRQAEPDGGQSDTDEACRPL